MGTTHMAGVLDKNLVNPAMHEVDIIDLPSTNRGELEDQATVLLPSTNVPPPVKIRNNGISERNKVCTDYSHSANSGTDKQADLAGTSFADKMLLNDNLSCDDMNNYYMNNAVAQEALDGLTQNSTLIYHGATKVNKEKSTW